MQGLSEPSVQRFHPSPCSGLILHRLEGDIVAEFCKLCSTLEQVINGMGSGLEGGL